MKIYKIGIALVICLLTVNAYSADRYWIAASASTWNSSANWSTTSGGAGGASVPGSSDVAIFNASGAGNCTVDAAINVAGLDIQTGYNGSFSQGSNAITIGASNAIFTSGTFTGGSASITVNGTFTLAGASFTSTSGTMTLNNTITYTSGAFTHNNGTVVYNGTNSQTIVAFNYYNLTVSGSYGIKSVTLANSGAIGIAGAFSNTATFSSGGFINTGSTIDYKGTGAQTIIAFNYYNLTSSSTGSRTLASSSAIGVANTFTKGTNSYTNTGSTIDYNGNAAQTIIAFNYNHLTISGSHAGNITLASSGTIGIAGAFSNNASFTSGGFVNTTSTISYNGTGNQTVIAFDYHHLTITGARTTNTITLANSGTIKIAGTFTKSATFTTGGIVSTSSTVEYNGTGSQTIGAIDYNNLTISGSHAGNITLSSTGIIGIAGAFNATATFTSGAYVNTSSTINYNGTGAQTIIAFNYNNLVISGARTSNNITLAGSGTIKIAKIFNNFATFATGSFQNSGSTIEFNGTITQTIPAFNYNNLTSSSSGSRNFSTSGVVKIAGTLSNGTNTYYNYGAMGEAYTPLYSGIGTSLNVSAAIDENTIFAAGTGGAIFKTTNGGASWIAQTSGTTNDIRDIAFYDSNNGIAVSLSGLILQTSNGGTTWNTITNITPATSQNLSGVYYVNATTVFAVGGTGVILKSTNGGSSWTTTTVGTAGLYGIYFTDENTGYISGLNGTILKTTNGGTSWTALSSGTSILLSSVYFTSASTGFVVGFNSSTYAGLVLKTIDAGSTWTTVTTSTDAFSIVNFVSPTNGYIVGGSVSNNTATILRTIDAGITWSTIYPGTKRFSDINIINSTFGFIAGLDGTMTKYSCCSDGGTVEFNGTGAQTIPPMNYNNLTISGSHTSNNVTLSSTGTIGISGNFSNSATFSTGAIINTGSTVDLNGNKMQSSTAFTYNNLTTSGTGSKSVSGNVTVGGALNLSNGEVAMNENTLSISSSTYSVLTRTNGYISSTGTGKLTRPTNSTNVYLFPMGYKTTNDSADYFVISLTPGKTAAQQFETFLHPENTGVVISHDKVLHGSVASTVQLSIATRSYNALLIQYDINTSADISAVRVFDANDNTYETMPSGYYTVTGGNQLSVPNIYQLCLIYSKAGMNSNMNWTYEINYDSNGLPVSEKTEYKDKLGRTTQILSRNVATNTIIATQTVYDSYGRPALQTLPAPVGSVMAYQASFINNNSGTAYTYSDFDKTATASNLPGEINNPVIIQNTIPGTLGYYYSENNTAEPFQATTSYPYARKEMTAGQRTSAAGDEYRMGAGHESKGYTLTSGDELKFIFGTSKSFKSSIDVTDKLVNSALTITDGIVADKSITINADGKEMVTYSYDGMAIASCYTGISGACSMTTITNAMVYAGTASTDIHLPFSEKGSLKLLLPTYDFGGHQTVSASDVVFKITDLSTNTLLVSGTDYSVNSGTRVVTFLGSYANGSGFFRISYSFTQTKLDYFSTNSITVPDAYVTYNLDYSRWSVNYYDLTGKLRKSVSPKGINCSSAGTITMATTYDYNSMGQLIASNSPDEGKKEIVYDSEGKARFSQNAVQSATNKFSYTNYDLHGRVIESGEYSSSNNGSSSVYFQNYYAAYTAPYSGNTASSSIINNIGNTGMLAADCGNINNVCYYPLDENIPSSYTYKNSYLPKYLMGKVAKTKNSQSTSWYGYDQAGHTVFTVQRVLDGDFATYNTTTDSQIKTVDYTYSSVNGTLTSQIYQKNENAEKLTHNFYYDAALRMTKVDVAIGTGAAVTQAKYYYSITGALKRKELGDKLQGVDYIYTVNGQLKSINHPACDETKDPGRDGTTPSPNSAFGKDVFGLALDYHSSDYVRSGTYVLSAPPADEDLYSGLISSVRNRTRATTNSVNNGADYIDYLGTNSQQILSSSSEEIMTQYTYDVENRLSTAVCGKFNNSTISFAVNSNNCFKEYGGSADGGIDYDANGNITSLKRNAYNGTIGLTMDDFSYTYTSNTNKLASFVDAATSTYTNDLDAATSKSFTYNSIGQMTADQAGGISTVEYYNNGLTKKVTFSSGNTAEYWYDDRGQKIKTKYLDLAPNPDKAKYTWYISDAGGNPLAIYEYDEAAGSPAFTLIDQPIYGSTRLGVIDRVNSNAIEYEITDHLGNVRATIKGISTGVYELTSRTDYYSFGGAMPGRTYNLNTYRYNYQGQENAVSSNWQQFDLRMHNSDLGRWMAPDPYGQFDSPYISMGNNPVSGIDPDGGYTNGFVHSSFMTRGYAMKQVYEGPDERYKGKTLHEYVYKMQLREDRLKKWREYVEARSFGTDGGLKEDGWDQTSNNSMHMNPYDAKQMAIASGRVNTFTEYVVNGGSGGIYNNLEDADAAASKYNDEQNSMLDNIEGGQAAIEADFRESIESLKADLSTSSPKPDLAFLPAIAAGASIWEGLGIISSAILGGMAIRNAPEIHINTDSYMGDPKDWHTTYEPVSENPIHRPPQGFDPNEPTNTGGAVKWLLGGKLLYELYNEYNDHMNKLPAMPKDNTYVVPRLIPYVPQ